MLSALTWRLRRHSLSPRRDAGAVDIAERMIATRAWPDRVGELSTTARQTEPEAGGVADALVSGELIAAYAFRGGAYIFTPATADLILTVRQITRVWESPRFQRQGAFAMESWELPAGVEAAAVRRSEDPRGDRRPPGWGSPTAGPGDRSARERVRLPVQTSSLVG